MGLKQITYDKILKKGKIQPSETTELTQALDLGGGDKTTWFVEDGYTWPRSSQNIIKSSKKAIKSIVDGFKGEKTAESSQGKISATYKICRQKVKFMETGGAAATKAVSDSKMTEIQEKGSAKVFEYAIKLNRQKYSSLENLMADKMLMDELTDIWVKESGGKIKKYLIEIKPKRQTKPPVKKSSKKAYIYEAHEYAKNQAKWKMAKEFCADRQWVFKVVTEKELGI